MSIVTRRMSSPDTEIPQHSGQLQSKERHEYEDQYMKGVYGLHIGARYLGFRPSRSTDDWSALKPG